ncbi:MAG: hypothetical protein AAF787_03395 [Chloroflexota bacterium]
MPPQEETLIYYVQEHERSWGQETYANRPDLAAILGSKVVVFWQSTNAEESRWQITLHNTLDEIEDHLTKVFLRSSVGSKNRRVARIFVNGKRVIIAGVKIEFREVEA